MLHYTDLLYSLSYEILSHRCAPVARSWSFRITWRHWSRDRSVPYNLMLRSNWKTISKAFR